MSRRLRVVLLDLSREWGASERQVLWLAEALAKGAARPVVAAHPDGQLHHFARQRGVPVVTVESTGGWEPFVARRLSSTLYAEGAALVHAFSADAAGLAWAALRGRSVPLVVSVHPDDQRAPSSRVARAIRGAAAVVVPNEAARQAVVSASGADPDRVGVVAPLVDLSQPSHRPTDADFAALGLPVDVPLAGFVGALEAGEGPLAFVQALALARQSVPGLRGVMLGSGALREAILAEAEGLGIADALVLTEKDDAAQRVIAASRVDLSCGTAVWRTDPVLRALAAGVPVVATAAAGVDALIAHEESGLLVPTADAAALAAAMTRLLTDAALRSHCATGGRRRATDFLLERASARTVAIYRAVLGVGHAPVEVADAPRARTPLNPILLGEQRPRPRAAAISRLEMEDGEIVLHPSQAIA